MKPLKVLWVEDSTVFGRSPVEVLSRYKGLSVAVCSSRGLSDASAGIDGGVIVVDAANWEGGLERLVDAVERTSARAPVVLLGRKDLLHAHAELILEGAAAGYVTHGAGPRGVWMAVKTVARGERWFEEGLLSKLFEEVYAAKEYRGRAALSGTERHALAGLVNGKTDQEIAESLGCTLRRVKEHMTVLRRKTGASNRSELAVYAVTHGLAQFRPAPRGGELKVEGLRAEG
jgi:two-component system nitrate/nitrite response regulator NarL